MLPEEADRVEEAREAELTCDDVERVAGTARLLEDTRDEADQAREDAPPRVPMLERTLRDAPLMTALLLVPERKADDACSLRGTLCPAKEL